MGKNKLARWTELGSYDNVIHIVPVQNLNLLAITLSNGETIVYPINDNIKKYSFRVKGEK